MKKILLGAMIALACFQNTNAQNQNPTRHHGRDFSVEKILERLDKDVDLTDEQEKQITALYTDFIKEIHSSKESRPSREVYMKQKENLDKKIQEILTKEQQQKWAEVKKARAEKRKAQYRK